MLYLIPTPIGNLGDMTDRALEILKSVDYIACEDTRISGKLLSYFEIKKPLIKHHKHNEKSSSEHIVTLLKEGKNIAYISDAGMPAISDPGKELVKTAIQHKLDYSVLPGASAVVTAYAASRFDDAAFYFAGFIDRKKRKRELHKLSCIEAPIIFYEAPHRILDFLKDVKEVFGRRDISVLRELSKIHETYIHSNTDDILEHSDVLNPKGEFVIVLQGYIATDTLLSDKEIVKAARELIQKGERKAIIAKELAKKSQNLSRNEIYDILNKL